MSMINEPGFWVLAFLVGFQAHLAVGAILAREHYRKLNKIADEVLSDEKTSPSDRNLVGYELYSSTVRWPFWLLVAFAPIVSIVGIGAAIVMFFSPKLRASFHEGTDIEDIDRLILNRPKRDISGGPLWRDDRRWRMLDHGFNAQALSAPLLTIWVAIWLAPALMLLALSGAIEPTAQMFRDAAITIVRWIASQTRPRHA